MFWKKKLTPDQYSVCRKGSTEKSGSGEWLHNKKHGTYICACCQQPLFESKAKYESGTGWPSFFDAVLSNIDFKEDRSIFFRKRVEVKCNSCDAHIGHVFEDGPQGQRRFCINATVLEFKKRAEI